MCWRWISKHSNSISWRKFFFGYSKRRFDLPPGLEHDSHRPIKVDCFILCMMQTISTWPRLNNSIHISQCDNDNTVGVDVQHVIIVLESFWGASKCHIAWFPPKFVKKCYVMQSNTRKKSMARIVIGPKGILPLLTLRCRLHMEVPIDKNFMDFSFVLMTLTDVWVKTIANT